MTEPAEARDDFALGLRHLSHERVDEAIVALEAATASHPTDAAVHAFLAAALFADARADAAEMAIARALTLDPSGFWSNLKAGELRFRLGDAVSAEDHFLVALRSVEPGTAEAKAAGESLVRARRSRAKSIEHRAFLPGRLHRLFARRVSSSSSSVAPAEARAGGP
jgi:tetratricopeptide (TPR) repeat protein